MATTTATSSICTADLDQAIGVFAARAVKVGAMTKEEWGRWVSVALPGGGMVRLHQVEKHPHPRG